MGDLSTDLPTLYDIVHPYTQFVNSFLTRLVPSYENILILAISFSISYALTHKYNWTKFTMLIMLILIYGGLRYLSFGVP